MHASLVLLIYFFIYWIQSFEEIPDSFSFWGKVVKLVDNP